MNQVQEIEDRRNRVVASRRSVNRSTNQENRKLIVEDIPLLLVLLNTKEDQVNDLNNALLLEAQQRQEITTERDLLKSALDNRNREIERLNQEITDLKKAAESREKTMLDLVMDQEAGTDQNEG